MRNKVAQAEGMGDTTRMSQSNDKLQYVHPQKHIRRRIKGGKKNIYKITIVLGKNIVTVL
jgi:hypothetical protein